ncbi:hypothetical protein ACTMMA_05865 [Ornithinimicrobium panacihumi]
MPFSVTSLPVPGSPDADPSADLLDLVEVERAHHRRLYGHEDLVHDARAVTVGLLRQERTARHRLLARDGAGRAIGSVHLTMPLTDNQHLAFFFPNWDPTSGSDEGQVYDALWATSEEILRESGRTSVQSWAMHPAPDDADAAAGPDTVTWLSPGTGTGRVAEDDRARWFTSRGFVLEQVELYSVLEVAEATLPPESGSTAYRIRSWVGATPPELLGPMARLYGRMSVDAPTGGIDYGEEQWDEAAVVEDDERAAAMGTVRLTTVALDAEGAPVAYTVIDHHPDQPRSADQDDTLVHGDHRGHGLGLAVKAANLALLRDHLPQVERVHTWNAAENAHMLAINAALGFREAGSQGGWQLRF